MIAPPAALLDLIRRGRRFMVAAHARPDGDALGSMLATAALLESLGKEVVRYCADPAPPRLRWLAGADRIRTAPLRLPDHFDASFAHDCGDAHLLGDNFPVREVTGPLVVLDHHATARPFGDLVWRDTEASAVGILVGRLYRAFDVALTKGAAEAIFCSLASDTGWFRYAATNVETFELATACVAAGASPWEFARRAEEEQPLSRVRLLREVLGTLELHGSAPRRVALLHVTDAHLSAAGAQPADSEGFVNWARGLEGVEVGALLALTRQGVRCSLRSKGGFDVGAVAEKFGGGGHRAAAGCTLLPPLDAAKAQLLAALGIAPAS